MKNKAVSIALAGVAIALLAAYILLRGITEQASRVRTNIVWTFAPADIAAVAISGSAGFLRFENDSQQGWILTSPEGVPYERSIAQALPLMVVNIAAEKKVAGDPKSFPAYGLESPTEITATLIDGAEHTLLLGSLSASGDAGYFSPDGIGVYTMSAAQWAALALDSLNILDKNVLGLNRTMRPSDIAARISNIRVSGESRPDLAGALARVTAGAFLCEGEFAKYGLEDPSYVIEFEIGGVAKALYLGAVADDNEGFYARCSESDYVFTVSRRGFAI